MTVKVKVRYATTPTSTPNSCTTITLNTPDTSISGIKEVIKAQHPGWYNIQVQTI